MSKTKHKIRKSGAKDHRAKERKLYNAITDVAGIEVGHCTDLEHLTGTTVVLVRDGAVAGVDVFAVSAWNQRDRSPQPFNLSKSLRRGSDRGKCLWACCG